MRNLIMIAIAALTLSACSATTSSLLDNSHTVGNDKYEYVGYVDVSSFKDKPDHAADLMCLYKESGGKHYEVLGTNRGTCFGTVVWLDREFPWADERAQAGWLPAGKYSYETGSIIGGISRVNDNEMYYDFEIRIEKRPMPTSG